MPKFIGERSQRQPNTKIWMLLGGVMVSYIAIVLLSIPIKIAMSRQQNAQPEAILVLGGGFDRTRTAGKLWQSHQQMDVWLVEFARYLPEHQRILHEKGVPSSKVRFHTESTDTVTNFTSTADVLKAAGIDHVYLVTSPEHLPRAEAISTIVYGSRGILVTSVPAEEPNKAPTPLPRKENASRTARDVARSILWLFTGVTGASLNPKL